MNHTSTLPGRHGLAATVRVTFKQILTASDVCPGGRTMLLANDDGVIRPVRPLEFRRTCDRRALLNRGARSEPHGGGDAELCATPETLAPFLMLIGADTFANADALRLFRRDCVRPDPLFEGSYLVRWHKARSTGEQQRQFSGTAPSSVPRLVERLLALTERLIPHAPHDERERLFLCRVRKKRERAGLVGDNALIEAFRKLIARWDVLGPDGRLLQFHLGMLRRPG